MSHLFAVGLGFFGNPKIDLVIGLFLPVLVILALGVLERVYDGIYQAYQDWRTKPTLEVEGD